MVTARGKSEPYSIRIRWLPHDAPMIDACKTLIITPGTEIVSANYETAKFATLQTRWNSRAREPESASLQSRL